MSVKVLPRSAATNRLREKGLQLGDTSLADKASSGTGPAYSIINGRAVYTEESLQAWFDAQLAGQGVTPARHSGSRDLMQVAAPITRRRKSAQRQAS